MTTCWMVSGLPVHDLVFPTVLQLQGLLHFLHDPHGPKIESSFSSCRGQGQDGEVSGHGNKKQGAFLLQVTWKIHADNFREFVF